MNILDNKRDDRYLTASGWLTLAVVAYVDSFLENPGAPERLLGYLLFASLFTVLETHLLTLKLSVQRLCLLAEALLAFAMLWTGHSEVMPILLVIWAAQIPKRFPQYWWVLLVVVNVVVLADALGFGQSVSGLITALVFFGFQWFAASSSAVRMRAKAVKEALEVTNIQLKSAQSLLAQQGKNQERLRIARDLHDGIGHKLTALSLKLEHASHTVDEPLRPFVRELKSDVADTLQQLRETVQQIRSSEQLSLVEVIKAVQSVLPPSITINWPSDLGVEDSHLAEQLAFCIQEGISNALRHGQADRIDIDQNRTTPPVITLTDNGRGGPTQIANNGLKGMNERLTPFGGAATLAANPAGRGMQLRLQWSEMR